jgi:hypothetical protein
MMRTRRITKRRMRMKSPRRRRRLLPRRKLNPRKKRHPRNVHRRRKKKLVVLCFCFVLSFGNFFKSRSLMRSLGKISLKSSMMCLPAQMKRMNLRRKRNLRRRLPLRNQLLKPKLSLKRNPHLK